MADLIKDLLKHAKLGKNNPPSISKIEEVERLFGGSIPDPLKCLWQYRQPVSFPKIDAHILSPDEIFSSVEGLYGSEPPATRGFIPVLDDHQSNYVAVCVRKPLMPRIIYIVHDGGSELLYRSFDDFLLGLLEAIKKREPADLFFHETTGDYPVQGRRTSEDHAVAQELLLTDGQLEQFNHAVQLLDEQNISEWAKLIELDGFIRSDAMQRLEKMNTPEIQELLKEDRAKLEVFCSKFLEAMIAAGHMASSKELGKMQIGKRCWNLEHLFVRRSIPDAIPRMILWIEDQLANRNPYDRAGHYKMD